MKVSNPVVINALLAKNSEVEGAVADNAVTDKHGKAVSVGSRVRSDNDGGVVIIEKIDGNKVWSRDEETGIHLMTHKWHPSVWTVVNASPVVDNALATQRVARNALTVEEQRANEKDKVAIKAVLDRINSKGAQLAKDINAYYAMNEKMLAEEKRLNAAVSALVHEARSEARKYSRVNRIYEDRDLVMMLNDLEFQPGWGKSCYKGSITHPTLINVPH